MVQFIIAIFVLLIALVAFAAARSQSKRINSGNLNRVQQDSARGGRLVARIVGIGLTLFGGFLLLTSILFTQGVGEAKVIVNIDGTLAGEKLEPGWGAKAPWQNLVDFDLFAQQATYAGNGEGAPDYTGGTVNGQEVTSAVARGAQVNFDLSVTYSLDADKVTEIYSEFKSQERFTAQIVNQQILSVTRDVPTNYTPVEFRGEKRGEATVRMQEALNEALNKWGVDVQVVNLQNVRYTDEVEQSIKNVEVAQQKEEQAQAELRATEVSAQAQIVEAEAAAEANRILTESLSEEILQQRYIDKLGEGTIYVVPEGSTPFIGTR